MQRAPKTNTGNRFLDALPHASLEQLQPHFEAVALGLRMPVRPLDHIYFPISGLISVVLTMQDGATVEVGIAGREGMYSLRAVLSSDDTLNEMAMVQLPGRALRLKARLLREKIQSDGALRKLLLRYIQAVLATDAQSAACNRLHHMEQRCARWLLACYDNAEAATFPMTHEVVAVMLGASRPVVSLAMAALRKRNLIAYNHGTLTLVDRPGLAAASCECYGVIQDELDRLFGASDQGAL